MSPQRGLTVIFANVYFSQICLLLVPLEQMCLSLVLLKRIRLFLVPIVRLPELTLSSNTAQSWASSTISPLFELKLSSKVSSTLLLKWAQIELLLKWARSCPEVLSKCSQSELDRPFLGDRGNSQQPYFSCRATSTGANSYFCCCVTPIQYCRDAKILPPVKTIFFVKFTSVIFLMRPQPQGGGALVSGVLVPMARS